MALSDLLVCPSCRGKLEDRAVVLCCPACRRDFPVRDGIPCFLDEKEFPESLLRANFNPNLDIFSERRNRYKVEERALVKAALGDGQRVLDIGCGGGGHIYRQLIEGGREVAAVDILQEYLGLVNRTAGRPIGVRTEAGSLPFPAETFDIALLTEVIEHIPIEKQAAAISEIHRVVCAGGRLILSTPNRRVYRFCRYLIRTLRFQSPLIRYRKLVPQHVGELTAPALRRLLRPFAAFRIEGINPYLPWPGSRLLRIGLFAVARK